MLKQYDDVVIVPIADRNTINGMIARKVGYEGHKGIELVRIIDDLVATQLRVERQERIARQLGFASVNEVMSKLVSTPLLQLSPSTPEVPAQPDKIPDSHEVAVAIIPKFTPGLKVSDFLPRLGLKKTGKLMPSHCKSTRPLEEHH